MRYIANEIRDKLITLQHDYIEINSKIAILEKERDLINKMQAELKELYHLSVSDDEDEE